MRLLAGAMNIINVNDEGRISQFLNLGTYTLPILVSILLFIMVFNLSKKYALTLRFQLTTLLIVMVISSIVILADQFFGIRIM